MRVTVLLGGTSAERRVSMATGRAVVGALRSAGHDVVAVDTATGRALPGADAATELAGDVGAVPPSEAELSKLARDRIGPLVEALPEIRAPEVVFVALHGGVGEDGRLQALLDLVGVPYTGSGHLGSALAMDKLVAKELFLEADVPTPPWLVAPAGATEVEAELGGFPVIVKPSREGSTVGVSVVRDAERLSGAIDLAARFGDPVMIERFVPGRELAVGVLGDEALPVVEIRPSHEIYDYECKYTHGLSEYDVPAPLPDDVAETVQQAALRAHRTLRLAGYSRIDFRLDDRSRPWCLEANSLPGLTETSLLPKAAAAAGLAFESLCQRIVELALQSRAGTRPAGRG